MKEDTKRSRFWRILPFLLILLVMLITGGIALAGVPTSLPADTKGSPPAQANPAQAKGDKTGQKVSPTSGKTAGSKQIALAPPVAPNVVLYDQYDNDLNNGIVSFYDPTFPQYWSQAADDFVVPSGQIWTVNEVDVRAPTGYTAPNSFDVFFYQNSGTMPGTPVYTGTATLTGNPDYLLTLAVPAILPVGTYWVSVQAQMSGGTFWYWEGRSVQSNNTAMMRNPPDGFGCGTDWVTIASCSGLTWPDQMYRLVGTVGSAGTPTPTVTGTPPTSTRTPTVTATVCAANYSIATASGTIVPGVTDTGNHADDGTTIITLPFALSLYGQSFTSAIVGSNGTLGFVANGNAFGNVCLPSAAENYAILPYWDDQRTDTNPGCSAWANGCGIFTTQVGSTFYIDYHTVLFANTSQAEEYEIILTQGSSDFSIVYGTPISDTASETIGVQRDTGSTFTQYKCNTANPPITSGLQLNFTLATCGGATSTSVPPTLTRTSVPPTATATCTSGGGLGPWTLAASYPLGPAESIAVASDGTYLYTAGGFNGAAATATYRYNPTTDTWTTLASMPSGVYDARAAYAPNTNSVYVFGGYNGGVLNTTYIYNVGTNTWTTGAAMPAARIWPNVAYDNTKIYVIGGLDSGFVDQGQTWEYDPVANTWNTSRASSPVTDGSAMTAVSGQYIYVMGGYGGGVGTTDHYRYDVLGNTWVSLAALPVANRMGGSGNIGGNNYMYGGGTPSFGSGADPTYHGKAPAKPNAPDAYTSSYVYNIAGNTWSTGPNLNAPHSWTSGTAAGSTLVVVAGYDGTTGDTAIVEKAQVAAGCGTATSTPAAATNTPTRTATATVCAAGYNYTVTTGATVVPGTVDIGNHCDDCVTTIALPFSFTLYGTAYTGASAGSNGALFFGTTYPSYSITCLPNATATYLIAPYWTDQNTTTSFCSDCGIFTSVSGTAPNRIFNIEWRGRYYVEAPGTHDLDYEVRLYETPPGTSFDVIYGQVTALTVTNDSSLTVGVQQNTTNFTQVGCDGTGGEVPPVSTGQRYAWAPTSCGTATSTSVPPTATRTSTAVATATATCVAGGGTPAPWAIVSPITTDAYGMSMASDGTYAYEGGGYSFSGGGMITQFERYNTGTGAWSTLSPVPDLNNGMASMQYAPTTNKVYMMGGDNATTGTNTNANRIYDVTSGTWSAGAPMPDVRSFAASGYYNGKIYVVGGYSTGNITPAYLQTWEYTVSSNTWLTKTSIPATTGFGGAASTVVNGHLYVAGGRDANNLVINTLWDYNIATDTWTARANLPASVNVPGGAAINGKFWVYGGGTPFSGAKNKLSLSAFDVPDALNTTYIYDPGANTWVTGPPLNVLRAFPGSTNVGNTAFAVGGYNGSTTVNSVETSVNTAGGCATPGTATATATPTACTAGYAYTTSTGATIVPGTVDSGNHCDDCLTSITLPFAYQLYDQSFSTASVDSNGTLQFVPSGSVFSNTCLPATGYTYTIFPHWDDLYTINSGYGIFTSVSGTAPNRIFNIEWRDQYFPGTGTANFEVRLYEGQTRFDIIYGTLTGGGTSATTGVQKNGSSFTQYSCNTALANGLMVTYTLGSCGTATNTPIPSTPTRTATSGVGTATPTCQPGGTPGPWQSASPIPASPGLGRYAFAKDASGNFYIIGGVRGGTVVNTNYRYNPTTGVWTTLASAPTLPGEAPSAAYYNGKIYLAPGYTVTAFQIYDIATDTWSSGPAFPGNGYGEACAAYNGYVYCAGGYSGGPTSTTWVYNISGNSWAAGPAVPTGFFLAGYQQVGQYLYVVGGFGSAPQNVADTLTSGGKGTKHGLAPDANSNVTERLDMTTSPGSWSTGPTWTMQRSDLGVAYDPNTNKLYALGGDTTGGGYFDSSTEVDELSLASWPSGTWTVSPPALPVARQAGEAGLDGNGHIYEIGGLAGPSCCTWFNDTYFRSNGGALCATATSTPAVTATPTCQPSAAGWSAGQAMPTPIVRAFGNYFPTNGKFYSVGGRYADTAGTDFQHVLEYTPSSNAWVQKGVSLPDNQVNNMVCGVLTVSGTPYIYCVGGSAAGATTATARVLQYNPVADTVATLNSADNWPGDSAGTVLPGGGAVVNNKLYVIGGFNINVGMIQQTWEFDPTAAVGAKWTQKLDYPVQRGYVPAAAIGGMIYTAGGSLWDGTTLQDSNDSYKFDPVANTWTAITNIPRATGETRAVVVGGLMWVLGGGRTAPNPSNEVDVYNPGSNAWGTEAPFANARRNFPADSDGTHVWLAGGYEPSTPAADMQIYSPGASCGTATPTPVQATATPTETPAGGTATPTCQPSGNFHILIAYSDIAGPPTTLVNQILAEPGVAAVDLFDAFSGTPTLSQLEQYQEVVAFSNNVYLDPVGMGDVLADYEDAGGVVVGFNFNWFGPPFGLDGRWMTGGYTPFNIGPTNFSNSTLGTYDPTHPLMQGVTTLDGYFRHNLTLTAGATQVAAWADSIPLIAVKTNNGHTAVGINNYVGENPNQWSGEFGRVVVNAVRWLGGGGCGTPLPTSTPVTPTATSPVGTPSASPTCVSGPLVFTGAIDSSDPTQVDRLFRGGVASTCGAPNPCSTLTGSYHYDLYGPFTNNTSGTVCVTVDIETGCTGTNYIFSGAYVGPFDPNNICTNNIGDPGLSGNSEIYSFDVPAGGQLWVNVHEVTAGAGCSSYQVTITGMPSQCGTPVPPTNTPTTPPTTPPTNTPTTPPTTPPSNTPTSVTTVVGTNTPTTQPTTPPTGQPTNTSTAEVPTNTPTVTPTACTLQFSDVPPGSTFYPYIHCLVCLGIVNGYPDGTFRPNNNVTRGQLSKIVSNSAGFNETPTGQQFQDVPPGSTFYVYIYRLVHRGYINGYPCGGPFEPCVPPNNLPYFRPNNPATRGQISKIVSNAAAFNDVPHGQQFQDVPIGSTFYPYIYRLSTRGIIVGYPCGGAGEPCIPPDNLPYFRPNANASRGQMSKIDAAAFFPDCNPPARATDSRR